MSANRESCDMRRVDRNWSDWSAGKPQVGEFQFLPPWPDDPPGAVRLYMMLPGENYCCIPVKTGDKVAKAWHWNGNEDKPTCTPSVRQSSTDSKGNRVEIWHGHIVAGRMVSC